MAYGFQTHYSVVVNIMKFYRHDGGKNNRHHNGIGRSPYKALFGEIRHNDCRGASLPNEVWKRIETEEQLAAALNINDSDDEDASRASDEYEIDLLSAVNDPVKIIIRNTCNERQYEGTTVVCSQNAPNFVMPLNPALS